jgi:hypothetical protein
METPDKPFSQRQPGTSCGPTDYDQWARKSWADKRRWGDVWFTNVWGTSHRDLPYINEPFNDPAAQRQWKDRGFQHQRFTGDLYDMRQPEPEWMAHFRHWLPMRHFSWSIYRMTPGTVLPEHSDTYKKFREIYSVADDAVIRRYVIFLENWQSGHYIEIDDGPVTKWIQGWGAFWNGDTPHIAANIGRTDRYTLQITGVIDGSMPPWRWQHANTSFF